MAQVVEWATSNLENTQDQLQAETVEVFLIYGFVKT